MTGVQTCALPIYLNGLDKSYERHIKEFQKRNIPVAVYAYVAANSKKEMEKEAESFYKASAKYHPTYYWLDVEEKTMSDMNAGVEAFRAKLESLGVKNIGIYIGTHFMEEHSISIKVRATKVGEDTLFAEIIRLVEESGASKAPIAKLADKVSGIFVPIVILLAIVTAIVWLILG